MSACPLGRCDGSGKLRHDSGWVPLDDRPVEAVEGESVAAYRSVSTSVCPCRRDLPPRVGRARWWELAEVFSEVWQASVYQIVGEVHVRAEVPISEENYVLERLGNRYYPTLIDLELTAEMGDLARRVVSVGDVFPDEAREFARILVAAADAADRIDLPDSCSECGLWLDERGGCSRCLGPRTPDPKEIPF